MECFAYPLDTKMLLRKKKSIKKELLNNEKQWICKKIAVLGGSTTNEVVDQLEIALLNHGIKAEFYQSEYGLYWEDAMFGNEQLDAFEPDIIYIHTNWRNITAFPEIHDTEDEVMQKLQEQYERFGSMWKKLEEKFRCPIIQNNFDRPNYRLLGNRDIWDYRGRSNFISRLNQNFYQYAQKNKSFYINDIDYLAQDYGLSEWGAVIYWNMYKYACCLNAIPYLAGSVANIIKSIFGKNKKLLALDLDNTLWGGVIGDDGPEGIKVGPDMIEGQPYYEFQQYCKNLQKIGVVLAVASKNDQENALEGLRHPDGVLKEEDFVSIKANWEPKNQNLKEIAEELSVGTDSFVFVDDNPVEQDIVRTQLPEAAVPKVESVENFIEVLDHSGYFEVTSLSTEDLGKTAQYQARAKAQSLQASFENYEDYLLSLEMKAEITGFEPMYVQRITQLTNKSNQFNLTTLRCSEDEVTKMQESPNYICLCGRLIDKFSDNGIVTVVAGEIQGDELNIKLWLMSCRVLKRELEEVMMNELMKKAAEQKLSYVNGVYIPTVKNHMVEKFYGDMGFELCSSDENGETHWRMKVDEYQHKKSAVSV